MTDQNNINRVRNIAARLRSVIDAARIDATEPEKAAALQLVTLQTADGCMDSVTIAHNLMGLAEAYLKSDTGTAKAMTVTEIVTQVLTFAAEQLMRSGIGRTEAAHLMLGFAGAWASKDKTPEAAEHLYRAADTIVAGSAKH